MKAKVLKEYIDLLVANDLLVEENVGGRREDGVEYVSYNSMDVKEKTLFICKGRGFKKEYLKDAIEKGAFCYIAEEVVSEESPYIIVKDVRKAMSLVSGLFFDSIWNEKLNMIGITGTKGKTTTTFFVKAIMDAYCSSLGEKKTGLLGGVYTFDGENTEKANKITTPETLELHRHLAKCVDNGCKYLVMETSSQALKYDRTAALKYKVACFLNLAEDHISPIEHRDIEDYFLSKLMILDQTQTICVNMEMEEGYRDRILLEAAQKGKNIVTFGRRPEADVCGYDIEAEIDHITLSVRINDRAERVKVNIGGFYNVDNVLAAIAVAHAFGVSFDAVREGLASVKVPGRMEVFTLPDKDVKVVVDYAHNEMSYNALFESVNIACPERKKTFIFGCVGERAFNRREIAGRIADREADKIIITEDDYAMEPFEKICNEIKAHISPDKDVHIIADREKAVRYGLESAEDGWIVITTGFVSGNAIKRGDKLCQVSCDLDTVKAYISEHQ